MIIFFLIIIILLIEFIIKLLLFIWYLSRLLILFYIFSLVLSSHHHKLRRQILPIFLQDLYDLRVLIYIEFNNWIFEIVNLYSTLKKQFILHQYILNSHFLCIILVIFIVWKLILVKLLNNLIHVQHWLYLKLLGPVKCFYCTFFSHYDIILFFSLFLLIIKKYA